MTMTREQAEAEAIKRNRHMGKHLRNTKTWRAEHNSVKGWHVALVDVMREPPKRPAAMDDSGISLLDVMGVMLMERVKRTLGE